MLLFLTVFGMSVEDLSEIGGAFLGVDRLTFYGRPVVGDTVTARSEVIAMRESQRRPHQGIVTWLTSGCDQNGELVVQFERTNLISKRCDMA
jgi:acyl dehydratase